MTEIGPPLPGPGADAMTDDLVTRLRHLVLDWRTRAAPQRSEWVSRIPPCCVEELAGCANELEEELDPRAKAPDNQLCRTPFEAFGHNETCARWVEGPESFRLLDHDQPCTCGGVELDPDLAALDGPR